MPVGEGMGCLSLGEDASTENIDIFGKKGEEKQAKNMHGTENEKNVGEVSKQAFPLLSRARGVFFVRFMAPGRGRMVSRKNGPFYREWIEWIGSYVSCGS